MVDTISTSSGATTTVAGATVSSGGTSTTKNPNFQTTAPNQTEGTQPTTYDPATGWVVKYGIITVYCFDSYGAYTGSQQETLNKGQSAGSGQTFIEPPTAAQGQVAVFNTATSIWTLTEDHRGTTIYSKADRSNGYMSQPGPIPDGYTTLAPSTNFDKWDATQGHWVTDVAAEHAALQGQAKSLMANDIANNVNFLKMFGQTPGPQYIAYMKAIAAIAWGQDTTSTSLPTVPTDPAQ